MPLIRTRTAMAANGQAFPLLGTQYTYMPFDGLVEFAILVDTGGTVFATVFSGTDVLCQEYQVDVLAVANPILYPDHYSLADEAVAGEPLSINLREGAAGTPVVRCAVKLTPYS